MQFLRNESQEAREAYENALKATGGDFVNTTGDTMTGTLEGPGMVMTSLASIAQAQIATLNATSVNATNGALTGTASLATGNIPTLRGSTLAFTGTASLAATNAITLNTTSAVSLAQVLGKVDHRGIIAGPLVDFYVSGASGTIFKVNNIERGYVSTNSCATVSFALRVDIAGKIYYIPVYLGKA